MSDKPPIIDEVIKLRELLDQHQEIDRLQGNRLQDLERALGETQAKLRASQAEVQRLATQLNAFRAK